MPELLSDITGSIMLQSVFRPVSTSAERIHDLIVYFFIGAAFILAVVISLVVYISIRFRERTDIPKPTFHLTSKAEILTIGVPSLMVIFFFYLTVTNMNLIMPDQKADKDHPDVIITGHQWWWEVEYPGTGVISANEIHLPSKQELILEFRAADVIHDWWVPALGPKMDMIPGRKNFLKLYIKQNGTFEGACSEFCGQQHAWMRIKTIVQSPPAFRQWLQQQAQPAVVPTNHIAAKGAAIFNSLTCASCHRIRGTDADGDSGPDLTHLESRETLLTGKITNTRENLRYWIYKPQKIKPGAHMPDLLLTPDSLTALTAYLSQLK